MHDFCRHIYIHIYMHVQGRLCTHVKYIGKLMHLSYAICTHVKDMDEIMHLSSAISTYTYITYISFGSIHTLVSFISSLRFVCTQIVCSSWQWHTHCLHQSTRWIFLLCARSHLVWLRGQSKQCGKVP